MADIDVSQLDDYARRHLVYHMRRAGYTEEQIEATKRAVLAWGDLIEDIEVTTPGGEQPEG